MKGGSGSESEEGGHKGNGNMELEVTFGGGLDDLTHRLQAKKQLASNKKNDTVWQAYERRRRWALESFSTHGRLYTILALCLPANNSMWHANSPNFYINLYPHVSAENVFPLADGKRDTDSEMFQVGRG